MATKKIGKSSKISVTPDGNFAACGFDDYPLHLLDMRDGQTVEELRECRSLVVSPYESVRFVDKTRPEIQTMEGVCIAKLERETFAILSIAFGLGQIAISESGGSVRCFETKTEKTIWRYQPPKGCHVLALGYSQQHNLFMGVLWPYEKGGAKSLLIFDAKIGDIQTSYPLGQSGKEVFCLHGKYLMSSEGWLVECSTGQICGYFNFPTKEYSD